MKKSTVFAVNRMGIILLTAFGIIASSVAFIRISGDSNTYQIAHAKGTLSGSGLQHWSLQAITNEVEGKLVVEDQQLSSIASLEFHIPIHQFHSAVPELGEMVQEMFSANHCTSLSFKQRQSMVLPQLKMAHVISTLSLGNSSNTVPFQFNAFFNPDQTITLKGKQSFRLSDFGIRIPDDKTNAINDSVSLNLEFLVTQQQTIL